jgi:hypothetical protein
MVIILILVLIFIAYIIWDRAEDERRESRLRDEIDDAKKTEPQPIIIEQSRPWWGWGNYWGYGRDYDRGYRRGGYRRPYHGGGHPGPAYRPSHRPPPFYAGPAPARPHGGRRP